MFLSIEIPWLTCFMRLLKKGFLFRGKKCSRRSYRLKDRKSSLIDQKWNKSSTDFSCSQFLYLGPVSFFHTLSWNPVLGELPRHAFLLARLSFASILLRSFLGGPPSFLDFHSKIQGCVFGYNFHRCWNFHSRLKISVFLSQ